MMMMTLVKMITVFMQIMVVLNFHTFHLVAVLKESEVQEPVKINIGDIFYISNTIISIMIIVIWISVIMIIVIMTSVIMTTNLCERKKAAQTMAKLRNSQKTKPQK